MRDRTVLIALVSSGIAYLPASVAHGGVIGLDERIAAQRAIEQVYWNHRIWPDQNPAPKPALDAVMPAAVIIDRAEDALRKSVALEKWWSRPIEAGQLQAELDRIAHESKDPAMLRELFEALGNDAIVAAECLARPLLVERLTRNWYAWDDRFHAATRARAEFDIVTAGDDAALRLKASRTSLRVLRLGEGGVPAQPHDGPASLGESEKRVSGLTLQDLRSRLRAEDGSGVEENETSFYIDRLSADAGDALTIERFTWDKRPFDDWWDEERRTLPVADADSGGSYSLPAVTLSPCTPDSWSPTRWGSPTSRMFQRAVWTGTEMIVWSGNDGLGFLHETVTGGRYAPATDSWLPTPINGMEPIGRSDFSMVWTGMEMIVWGGSNQSTGLLNSGGRYNPQLDSWSATSTSGGVPPPMSFHAAVWSGSEMLIWGGGCFSACNTGARYSPATDTWQAITTVGAPSDRFRHSAVWMTGKLIVWGGSGSLNTGGQYDPGTDTWMPTSTAGAASGRSRHTAVVAGSEMIVWGGEGNGGIPIATGGRYNPLTDTWTTTSTGGGTPAARMNHTAVWTGSQMLVMGGGLTSGGRYSPITDSWTAMSTVNSPLGGTGVWTGTEMLVWGGYLAGGGSTPTRSGYGARYRPSNNTWTPMASNVGLPGGGPALAAVWTGTEMIVTGNAASRYDPVTNTWAPAATTGAPSIRKGHFSVWTGTEVIVWGGYPTTNTGARYNPSTNIWTTIPVGGSTPSGRHSGSEAWTGKEMIVWGGYSETLGYLNSGGRYDPQTGAWALISAGAGVPSPRADAATVWTGSQLLVWGGNQAFPTFFADGSRYDPVTNAWTPMSNGAGVPSARTRLSAVWTGTEFIPWGGESQAIHGDGGRYDPVLDTWSALNQVNQPPAPRGYHVGLWTGTEMIVWGGRAFPLPEVGHTGGRYDPPSGIWTPTSTGPSTPPASENLVAVWTGTQMIVWGGTYNQVEGDEDHTTGGCYCPGTCVTPGALDGLTVVKKVGVTNGVLLAWEPTPGATGYDVQAGPLLALRNSGGNFTTSTTRCIAQYTRATSEADAIPSQPGDGTWYLVRARNCSGGTFDLGSSQQGSRDAEIGAAAAACE